LDIDPMSANDITRIVRETVTAPANAIARPKPSDCHRTVTRRHERAKCRWPVRNRLPTTPM
jgi:hypothetical protein